MPPPPPFGRSPSPALRAVADRQNRSRGAIAPELCLSPRTKNRLAPCNKREAKRRQAHCPTNRRLRGSASLSGRARLSALHRGTRHRLLPRWLSPRTGFSQRLELAGVLPAYILAVVKHAPCGPVLLPVDRCPRAARERVAFIRARAPHSLAHSESALAKGALGKRDGERVTEMGTLVKVECHRI
jgi:hypothetical protein